jgi:SAM-dependent methyltransferase
MMTNLFPEALIDILKPADPDSLVAALGALQAGFTTGRAKRRGGYLRQREAVAAYGVFYGMRTATKVARIIEELRPRQRRRILDIGCGTLAASLGAVLDHDATESVDAFDRSRHAMAWGREKLLRLRPQLKVRCHPWEALRGAPKFPPADIALVTNLLNELNDRRRANAVVRAAVEAVQPHGLVLIIEPGTRSASKGLIRLREETKDFLPIAGPCRGAPICPYAADPRAGWCFSELHGEEPDWYRSLRQAAKIAQPRLTYSWLAFAEPSSHRSEAVRVISGPMEAGRYICGVEGRALVSHLTGDPRRGALLDLPGQGRAARSRRS